MRTRNTAALVVLLAVMAACGVTQQQRELQAITAITEANDGAAKALDFNIIKADEGEAIQVLTRTATAELKRAIAARRAGVSRSSWDSIMDIVFDTLTQVSVIMAGKDGK